MQKFQEREINRSISGNRDRTQLIYLILKSIIEGQDSVYKISCKTFLSHITVPKYIQFLQNKQLIARSPHIHLTEKGLSLLHKLSKVGQMLDWEGIDK